MEMTPEVQARLDQIAKLPPVARGAILGLVAALDAQGEASTEARADLEASWARADVWIRASRF